MWISRPTHDVGTVSSNSEIANFVVAEADAAHSLRLYERNKTMEKIKCTVSQLK